MRLAPVADTDMSVSSMALASGPEAAQHTGTSKWDFGGIPFPFDGSYIRPSNG